MGYRSTVVLAVEKEVFELEGQKIKEALLDADSITSDDHYYYIRWESVKWYDSYEDVQAITAFVDDKNEHVRFVRVGENMEDVEDTGQSYDAEVFVVREIQSPKGQDVDLNKVFKTLSVKYIEDLDNKTE